MGVLPLAWKILKINTILKSLRCIYIVCLDQLPRKQIHIFGILLLLAWKAEICCPCVFSPSILLFFPLSSRRNQHSKTLLSSFSLSPPSPSLYVDVCHHFSLLACEHCRLYIQILHFADLTFLGSVNFFLLLYCNLYHFSNLSCFDSGMVSSLLYSVFIFFCVLMYLDDF